MFQSRLFQPVLQKKVDGLNNTPERYLSGLARRYIIYKEDELTKCEWKTYRV